MNETADSRAPYRWAFGLGGALTLFGAGLHVWWHWLLQGLPQLASMTPVQEQSILLYNLCVVVFLTIIAALSFWLARSRTFTLGQLRGFALLLGALWIGRFGVDLLIPVPLPLLTEDTSTVIRSLIGCGLVLLASPEAYLRLVRNPE